MNDLFAHVAYPKAPGFKARATARSAAEAMQPRAPRLRQLCLDQLQLYGAMTADECAANLRIDKLSIRPRFSELATTGAIEDTGQRRKNGSGKQAIVWSLTPEPALARAA
jgi:predicted ArsR family transcriptional regulator